MSDFLDDKETQRFVYDLMESAGEAGLEESEAQKAIEEVNAILIQAALVEGWRKGHLGVSWSVEAQELGWKLTDKGNAAVEDMGLLGMDGNRRQGR